MSTDSEDTVIPEVYSIVSVDKIDAPDGSDGNDWYRYVVARDNSEIVGQMRGTLKQVNNYAKEFVDNLNVRAASPNRRSPWTISPTQKILPKKV